MIYKANANYHVQAALLKKENSNKFIREYMPNYVDKRQDSEDEGKRY